MFQQPIDITQCLAPFDLSESAFAQAASEVEDVTLSLLFHNLSEFISLRINDESALRDFIIANAVEELLADGVDAFEARFAAMQSGETTNVTEIFDAGVVLFQKQQIAEAIFAFAIISTVSEVQAPVLTAMAACACFQMEYGHGFHLAEESVVLNENHPRTYLISGYCALQIKDNKNAKRYLALASRLARNDSRYRNEQRCAQRELLMMQLAS